MPTARVAITQIDYQPSWVEDGVDWLECIAPPSDAPDPLTGHDQWGGIVEMRRLARQTHCRWLTAKLVAIVKAAVKRDIDLLVFPEYSVPAEALPDLQEVIAGKSTAVVAGTHTITNRASVLAAYESVGLSLQDMEAKLPEGDEAVSRAVCPVLLPRDRPHLVFKEQRSKWEGSMVVTEGLWEPTPLAHVQGCPNVAVMICIDALAKSAGQLDPVAAKLSDCALIAVPAISPTTTPFEAVGQLQLLHHRPVAFCNAATFGGSRLFAHIEGPDRFVWPGLTTKFEANPRDELIMGCDLSLAPHARMQGVPTSAFAVENPFVVPICYQAETDAFDDHDALVKDVLHAVDDTRLADAQALVTEYLRLNEEGLPPLVRRLLQELAEGALEQGTTRAQAEGLLDYAILPREIPSTRQVRLAIANHCQETLISRLPDAEPGRAAIQLATRLQHVATLVPALIAGPPRLPKDRQGSSWILAEGAGSQTGEGDEASDSQHVIASFRDRSNLLSCLENFQQDDRAAVLVVYGAPGMGKRTGVTFGLMRHFPEWTVRRLRADRNWGLPRLVSELAYLLGDYVAPDRVGQFSDDELVTYVRKLLKRFDAVAKTVLTIEDFHYVVQREGDRGAFRLEAFLKAILGRQSLTVNKIVFTSSQRWSISPDLRPSVTEFELKYFDDPSFTRGVIKYWCRLGSSPTDVSAAEIPDAAIDLAHGHPLCAKLAAGVIASGGTLVEADGAPATKFTRRVVSHLLQNLSLTEAEVEVASFVAVFRRALPLYLIDETCDVGSRATCQRLLDVFVLTETTNGELDMHPLLREHFRGSSGDDRILEHHGSAAQYFRSLLDEQLEFGEPDPGVVAEMSYHAGQAGDLETLQQMAERVCVEELKPRARQFYQEDNDYDEALRWYEFLGEVVPNDTEILMYILRCRLRTARDRDRAHEEAHALFELILSHFDGPDDPASYWVYRDYAQILVTCYSWEAHPEVFHDAEEHFATAERLNPSEQPDANTISGRAYLAYKQGDTVEAETQFRRALVHWPEHEFSLYWLCIILIETERIEDAERYYAVLKEYHYCTRYMLKIRELLGDETPL